MLRADVSRIDAGRRLGEALSAAGLEPEIVVNNAGFGLVGDAVNLDRGEQLAMIDLNVRTYHPVLIAAGFADTPTPLPWLNNRELRFRFPPR